MYIEPFENSKENMEDLLRKMQRMADSNYLHTISMTELYQTSYKSRAPIIEDLLYVGAYILAGAPKIGKSFLVAQIAYHVSTGVNLWAYKVHQGTVLYPALEDDFQRIQNRMFMMYGVNDTEHKKRLGQARCSAFRRNFENPRWRKAVGLLDERNLRTCPCCRGGRKHLLL